MRSKYSSKKGEFLELGKELGISQRRLAKTLDVSQSSVSNHTKKYEIDTRIKKLEDENEALKAHNASLEEGKKLSIIKGKKKHA